VCVRRSCIERVDNAVLSRALKTQVAPFEQALWRSTLSALAEKRVLEMVGLARRQGQLVVGVDDVVRVCKALGQKDAQDEHQGLDAGSNLCDPRLDNEGVVIVALDLSERSKRRLPNGAVFVTSGRLGQAVGMGTVGAMQILPGRLAEQAAHWLAVWYETRATTAASGSEVVGERQ
jgi:hypothetical protein